MSSKRKPSSQPLDEPQDAASVDPPTRNSDPGEPLRGSMADLERELANLLDDAPLLPDDGDDESDTDFVPPPGLRHAAWIPPESGAPVTAKPLVPRQEHAASPHHGVPNDTAPSRSTSASRRKARAARRSKQNASKPPTAKTSHASETEALVKPSRARGAVTLLVVGVVLALGWYLNRQTRPPAPTANAKPEATRAHTRTISAPAVKQRPPPASSAVTANEEMASEPVPVASALASASAAPEPDSAAPKFDMVKMLAALAPAGIQASRCRRTGDRKGKVFVRVEFGPGGAITTVDAGHAYKGSETAACIERKLRAAKLPAFSGEGGAVVLPILLK